MMLEYLLGDRYVMPNNVLFRMELNTSEASLANNEQDKDQPYATANLKRDSSLDRKT